MRVPLAANSGSPGACRRAPTPLVGRGRTPLRQAAVPAQTLVLAPASENSNVVSSATHHRCLGRGSGRDEMRQIRHPVLVLIQEIPQDPTLTRATFNYRPQGIPPPEADLSRTVLLGPPVVLDAQVYAFHHD